MLTWSLFLKLMLWGVFGGSGADLENYAERSCKVKDAGYLTGSQCLV